ncbi:MAG: energy transducer TonB [Sulfurovaceae bacterium]
MHKIILVLFIFSTLVFSSTKIRDMQELANCIKHTISINKSYPQQAFEANITGESHALFVVDKHGHLKDVKVTSTNDFFTNASIVSIRKSFPITIPKNLKNQFPKKFLLTIRYRLQDE